MSSKVRLLALISGLAVGFTACGGDSSTDGSSDPSKRMGKADSQDGQLIIREDLHGKTVEVNVGEQVRVELEGNPSTGYNWSCLSASRTLPLIDSGYEPAEPEAIGSGGVFYFVFQPDLLLAGREYGLSFEYTRPWQETVPPEKVFEVTLAVRGGSDKAVVIREADDGQEVEVKVGETVRVELEGNATTGYQWMTHSSRTLPLLDSGYLPDDEQTEGSGGTYYFVFRPDSFIAGRTYSQSFFYQRAWEGEPEKTFTMVLVVESASEEVTITADDDGQTVPVKMGDTVRIELEGNPSTGYQWILPAYPRSLPLVDQGYEAAEPEAIGSGGTFYFIFKPDIFAAGQKVPLRFEYVRTWEDEAPEETFSVTLDVAAN